TLRLRSRVGSRFVRTSCALMLLAAACTARARRSDESDAARSAAPVDDTARLARLEREARALAKTTGCSSDAQCRTAPVGWRSCGGPRTYVVYCSAATDSVAFFRKLDELKQAEIAHNRKSGMMSTREMPRPPP